MKENRPVSLNRMHQAITVLKSIGSGASGDEKKKLNSLRKTLEDHAKSS